MTNNPTPTGETRQTSTDDTTSDPRQAYRDFARRASITVLALALLGFLPTRRVAGDAGLLAMVLALVTSLAASVAGTLPVWNTRFHHPSHSVPAHLAAMGLRLLVVLVLGIALALSGLVTIPAFLVWLAIGHSALLITDTLFARSITAHAMHHSTRQSPRPAATESR